MYISKLKVNARTNIDWTVEAMQDLDSKTKKILNKMVAFPYKT